MATFAAFAGARLPEKDRAGEPITFDSYDMSPILFGKGKWERENWFYFTENELSPGAFRWHPVQIRLQFLRGDNGEATGGLAVDTNLGWKGAEKYVATVPQIFDLLADPQERYDIFMTNFTENTWTGPVMVQQVKELMMSYLKYPPRKLQSYGYTGLDHHVELREVRMAAGGTQSGRLQSGHSWTIGHTRASSAVAGGALWRMHGSGHQSVIA